MTQINEDFEKEFDRDSIYLYEKENDLWIWWHEQWRGREGIVEIEGIEEEELIL